MRQDINYNHRVGQKLGFVCIPF